MSVPGWGVFNPNNETGKFYIGDELVICSGFTEFLELVEKHMGEQAADYLHELVGCMIEKKKNQRGGDDLWMRKRFPAGT